MDFALTIVVNYILLGFLCALPGAIIVQMIQPSGLLKDFGNWLVEDWEDFEEQSKRFWVKFWTCSTCWSLRVSLIVGGFLIYSGTPLFLVGVTILSAYFISDKL